MSKRRTEPSAPLEMNTNSLLEKQISNTSLSCAINCVRIVVLFRSQIVHVVSSEAVPSIESFALFQSKEVKGPQYFDFLLKRVDTGLSFGSVSLKL